MKLKRITTKDGEVYFVDSVTGERVKTQMDTLKSEQFNCNNEASYKNYKEEVNNEPKKKNTGKNIFYLFIIVITIMLVGSVIRQINREVNSENFNPTETARLDDLKKQIKEFNDNCPYMIDSETRLDGMEYDDKSLYAYYTLIKYEIDELDMDVVQSKFKSVILNKIKTDPNMKVFKDLKFTFIHNYNDKNGKRILTLKFTPKDYL